MTIVTKSLRALRLYNDRFLRARQLEMRPRLSRAHAQDCLHNWTRVLQAAQAAGLGPECTQALRRMAHHQAILINTPIGGANP